MIWIEKYRSSLSIDTNISLRNHSLERQSYRPSLIDSQQPLCEIETTWFDRQIEHQSSQRIAAKLEVK
jgi:hypothetical protein